jgi:hypothetical protein
MTEPDYSFDRIGDRLDHPDREPELSADDRVRARWVLDHTSHAPPLLDVGASDGALVRQWIEQWCMVWDGDEYDSPVVLAIEPHRGHRKALECLRPDVWTIHDRAELVLPKLSATFLTIRCTELLEHLDEATGAYILNAAKGLLHRDGGLVVTVPNRDCASIPAHRQRWNWPDHRRHFTASSLRQTLETCGWRLEALEPIVGDRLDDSIWLGAVCR